MIYQVEIVETLAHTVAVQTASAEEAERLIRERYRAGEIVLGGDDCVGQSIRAVIESMSE